MITKSCRICGNPSLQEILDLGHHPLSDAFLTHDDLSLPETHYPLVLLYCSDCDYFQLSYTVDPGILYQRNYPYRTGNNEAGRSHFHELANEIVDKEMGLAKSDGSRYFHVDIGGNDGTLCEFMEPYAKTLNVDPAGIGGNVMASIFSSDTAKMIYHVYGSADIITATNVLAHIHDLTDFLKGVKTLLAPDGIFIVEVPDALKLINSATYDTIYHEHLSYFTRGSIWKLMKANGFVVIGSKDISIHGGSIRYYIKHDSMKGVEWENKVHSRISPGSLKAFTETVHNQRTEFRDWIYKLKRSGKRIIGISAPAKGNTILNYCGIGPEYIDYIMELPKSPKVGLYTPGQHIPVVMDEVSTSEDDIGIIFAWNWAEQIMERSRQYGFKGDFLIPIPRPKFIESIVNLKPFEGYYYGHK